MQPTRTLADIISSLNQVYQPQVDLYRQQQAALPAQAQAQSDALGAKKDQAFNDILAGARRRNLGFSGIPLGDQAKYLATDYAPALANLETAKTNQATSLEQAILQLQQQQNQQAQGIYQTEQDRAEQARQFNANLAAQREAAARQSASLGGLFNSNQQQAPAPLSLQGATLKNAQVGGSGGYNFSFGGKPISAVGFASVNNLNPADVLYSMASSGDTYAAQAYKDIVNNGGKITPQLAQKYYSLFWGTNLVPTQAAAKAAPKPSTTISPAQNVQNNSKKSTTALLFGGR